MAVLAKKPHVAHNGMTLVLSTGRNLVPHSQPAAGAPVRADADALIVGAGPAGLYAAYYAGFRGLSVVVMDSLPEIGGQVSAMYPEKLIYDVAGFPAIRGRDLIAGLAAQAGRYAPRYLLGEEACSLEYTGGVPVVTTSSGSRVRAGFVVVTGGIGRFTPRRLPALASFEGRGVAYFVPRPEDYRDADVVVVGGGDSAFDWVLTLAPLARSVTLVHRRETFRAHEALVRQVRELSVPVITSAEVVAACGDGCIEAVDVADRRSGEVRRLKAQGVVAALGFTADIRVLEAWGLKVTGRHLPVDTTMATNLDRVYAAGDITDYPGKVRLISVGFGEAATAVNNAVAALDPGAGLFPGHSSDLPGQPDDISPQSGDIPARPGGSPARPGSAEGRSGDVPARPGGSPARPGGRARCAGSGRAHLNGSGRAPSIDAA
jgi:thioredoxin reductase